MKRWIFMMVWFVCIPVFSQDTLPHDASLRVRLILEDSVGIAFPLDSDEAMKIYRFKIDSLYRGVYKYPHIYVGAREAMMRQFNLFLNTGVEYWWGITHTKKWFNGFPVYRHSSSW